MPAMHSNHQTTFIGWSSCDTSERRTQFETCPVVCFVSTIGFKQLSLTTSWCYAVLSVALPFWTGFVLRCTALVLKFVLDFVLGLYWVLYWLYCCTGLCTGHTVPALYCSSVVLGIVLSLYLLVLALYPLLYQYNSVYTLYSVYWFVRVVVVLTISF
jgi:hypothetical protein